MTSELCPFCGKSFKRLKSHLPHCKAAIHRHGEPEPSSIRLSLKSPPTNPENRTSSKNKAQAKTDKTVLKERSENKVKETTKTKLKLSEQIRIAAKRASVESSSTSKDQTKDNISAHIAKETKEIKQSRQKSTDKRASVLKKTEVKAALKNKTTSTEGEVGVNAPKLDLNTSFLLEDEEKLEKLRSPKAKITLQDVRATLGRSKQKDRQRKGGSVGNVDETKRTEMKESPAAASQLMTLKPEKREIVLWKSGDFMRQLSRIQNKESCFDERVSEFREGLRMDRLSMGLGAPPETDSQRNPERNRVLTQPTLGQVTLRELPHWLISRFPRSPGDVVVLAQSGWQWYYSKYINVRRGGVGGVAMLLAGYCVLGYIWNYPHLKQDRWRKYH